MTICSNCESTEIKVDSARGIVCCEECGMIQEDNLIVNSLQFDTNGAKSSMQGKIINVENKNVGTKYVDSCYYIKNTIRNICSKLHLTNKHMDIAFRWYKLCLANNLTKGKSILYTLSACIYISCRQENTPHLLIDFSNVLRIDMYQIGKIYSKIRKTFELETHNKMEDMSIYIHRFVSQLKFTGAKEIIVLSTRILSRMKKDWIMEGRKPNNSCGAAILLASRILGEPRDISEIAKIVHAAPSTISKRLREIAETETALMDLDKFNNEWLDRESMPPITQSRFKALLKEEAKNRSAIEKSGTISSTDGSLNGEKESTSDYSSVMLPTTPQSDEISVNSIEIKKDEISKQNTEENLEETSTPENFSEDILIEEMILNEDEVEHKKILWEELYGEYIKEAEIKKKVKKSAIITKQKKKHNFATVEEAFKSLDKKVSSKLNYSAISELFEP